MGRTRLSHEVMLMGSLKRLIYLASVQVTRFRTVLTAETLSRGGGSRLNFTLEVTGTKQLQHALKLINNVPNVQSARRV